MKDCLHVFPDTNVFLHYPPLSQIDWRKLCDASNVHLVVCLQVVHELDDKKSDTRLGARAERAIKEIREGHRSGRSLREGVTISIFNRELRREDFATTLSPDSGDDKIVHLAQMYRDHNPGQEVAIATEDFGMELRCEVGGIPALRMDKACRLPNPQDELTKKYRQTVDELNTLKNRLPRLSLWGSPAGKGAIPADQTISCLSDVWRPADIEMKMGELRIQYPKQSPLHAHSEGVGLQAALSQVLVSQEQWQRYDRELDGFYDRYRDYLKLQNTVAEVRTRSIALDLWLANDGSGPATDIDVTIRFPAAIIWVAMSGSKDADLLEKDVEPPTPPRKPQPAYLALQQRVGDWRPVAMAPPDCSRSLLDEGPSVVKSDDESFELHAHLGRLKHGHSKSLGTLLAVFSSCEDVKPFQAAFAISASEVTEKREGNLSVKAVVKSHQGEEMPLSRKAPQ